MQMVSRTTKIRLENGEPVSVEVTEVPLGDFTIKQILDYYDNPNHLPEPEDKAS